MDRSQHNCSPLVYSRNWRTVFLTRWRTSCGPVARRQSCRLPFTRRCTRSSVRASWNREWTYVSPEAPYRGVSLPQCPLFRLPDMDSGSRHQFRPSTLRRLRENEFGQRLDCYNRHADNRSAAHVLGSAGRQEPRASLGGLRALRNQILDADVASDGHADISVSPEKIRAQNSAQPSIFKAALPLKARVALDAARCAIGGSAVCVRCVAATPVRPCVGPPSLNWLTSSNRY